MKITFLAQSRQDHVICVVAPYRSRCTSVREAGRRATWCPCQGLWMTSSCCGSRPWRRLGEWTRAGSSMTESYAARYRMGSRFCNGSSFPLTDILIHSHHHHLQVLQNWFPHYFNIVSCHMCWAYPSTIVIWKLYLYHAYKYVFNTESTHIWTSIPCLYSWWRTVACRSRGALSWRAAGWVCLLRSQGKTTSCGTLPQTAWSDATSNLIWCLRLKVRSALLLLLSQLQ